MPIVALDVPTMDAALALADSLPDADFFKVGLQLYTAAGPEIVQVLKTRGHGVFLDLKLHDIPNTVAGAVRSAAALGVDLLTVHASGGAAMLRAATEAAALAERPRLFAVTVLTSLRAEELALAWGRDRLTTAAEVVRLARLADEAGAYGVVTSLHEVALVRESTRRDFPVLTPGIRLPGDDAGDQARIGSPREAAELGVDFVVVGRTVTATPDPAAAFARVVRQLVIAGSEPAT